MNSDEDTPKQCRHCQKWLHCRDFYTHRQTADGRQSWCIDCMKENSRRQHLRRRYGVDV